MVNIRDFVQSDEESYVSMSADFYSGDCTLFPVSEKNFRDTFKAVLAKEGGVRGFIIEENGKTAGYALAVSFWSCEAGGMNVLLDEIYLLPEYRGRGIGSEFLEKILSKYSGAKRFRLEVCPRNPRVKKLYERFGFGELDYVQMVRE